MSQNSQENTCARKTKACNFIKKETLAQVLSCEFCEISKNIFFTENIRVTASPYFQSKQEESQKLHSPPTKEKTLKRKLLTFDRFLIFGIY